MNKIKYDLGLNVSYCLPMKDGDSRIDENIFIGIVDGKIARVSNFKKSYQQQCKKWIDGTDKVALPGLINGHAHLPMTLFRGIADDVPLKEWLNDVIFPLEKQFVRPDFVRCGTQLAALECIRFGTTTVNDMYYFPKESAYVWDRAGLRGIFSQTIIGFPTPEDTYDRPQNGADKKAKFTKLLEFYKDHPRIQLGLAPHSPYTVDSKLLVETFQWAEEVDVPYHIHVAETLEEYKNSLEIFKQTPVQRLADLGVLGPRTRCAHMVHLDEKDFAILKNSKASVIYNPDSNLKLASGVAPISRFLQEGIPVSIGTDGAASKNDLSLFGALNVGTKIQRLFGAPESKMTADQALKMATWAGAKALGLGSAIGSLEEGKNADIILIDLDFPHLKPVHNLVSQLIYSANGLEVDVVICHGQVLLKNKKWTKLKTTDVYRRIESFRKKIKLFHSK